MSELKFKGELSEAISCVQEVVGFVRDGSIQSKKKEALDHSFYALGQLNALFMPADKDDNEPPVVGDSSCPETLEGCCDDLESNYLSSGDGVKGVEDYYKVAQLVFQIVSLLLKK